MEVIYNLFVFIEKGVTVKVGGAAYEYTGPIEGRNAFLQKRAEIDYSQCHNSPLPNEYEGLTADEYQSMTRLGPPMELFSRLLEKLNSSQNFHMCLTDVLDGKPQTQIVGDAVAMTYNSYPQMTSGKMDDYLDVYKKGKNFDIGSLIHDDYFKAIKMLSNAKHYVSAVKLIMSFIDTAAFIEYGDIKGVNIFTQWLDTYCDLSGLDVTAAELWELRNSLVHMSNLESRAVIKGDVKKVSFFIGPKGAKAYVNNDGLRFFNYVDFYFVLADAVTKWIHSYNVGNRKLLAFVTRYDKIISDARVCFHPK